MKNKHINYLVLIFLIFVTNNVYGQDQFNFDVKEIFITDNGNKFIGKNKGTISSNTGVIIDADEFEYDKKLNLLTATGNVVAHDKVNNYFIYSKKIIYDKKKEIILTKEKSKGVSLNNNVTINADEFEYDLRLNSISASSKVQLQDNIKKYKLNSDYINYSIDQGQISTNGNSKFIDLNKHTEIFATIFRFNIQKNIIEANNNVIFKNLKKNIEIFSDEIRYLKNKSEIYTKGKTSANIESKYIIETKDTIFFENEMKFISDNQTTIKDKNNIYETSNLKYYIEEEFFKGKNILINSNYKTPQNDKYYFAHGMVNLKNNDFIAGDTKIKIHKDVLDNPDNDPRIIGKSSKKQGDLTFIRKGVFTSCKEKDNCPPWAIQASEIKHDQNKKEISYENAILKFYNVPVFYFPKFFHPDPTVKRRSGILKPVINDSNVLGSSLTVPYYHVFSDSSDLTIAPSRFDTGSNMLQNEYRTVRKNSDTLINFGYVNNYKSALQNKNKNISYIFSKTNFNLNLSNFISSEINFNFEKVNNDSFLKIFDSNLNENTSAIKPVDNSIMNSELKLNLNHEDYDFTGGIASYENLQKNKNDRYQYVLPYYDFNKTLIPNFLYGSLNFNSSGSNDLNNTNQLTTKVTNNLSFSSLNYITQSGFKNNFNVNLKNLNSVGKNVSDYKTSPQLELSSLLEANTSIPLKKLSNNSVSFLTPKISMRLNPSDMKNHKNTDKTINVENIFAVDRFGFGDTYESGKSITFGIDYRNEKFENKIDNTLKEMNKYFEIKLATVLRENEENLLPSKTTLNKKTSNIFGSMSTNFVDHLDMSYNFALDKNLNEIEHNDFSTTLSFDKFSTTFNFVKSKNEMGNENFINNTTSYKFDDQNYINFNTRRNRRLNLTEFYNLVYEYRNDCLIAGVKYKKSYYEDNDLKPTEDLFFSVTFVPLTTFEQKVNQ
ncbi:LPS-assembly protein LptD [Candidatus Pelagibacter sp.]|uniref:LPS-assembly protein LptD n=1 Tax=Candidatus Pelagibacter sp. TaxID=2024849 RepID=UPI003F833884